MTGGVDRVRTRLGQAGGTGRSSASSAAAGLNWTLTPPS